MNADALLKHYERIADAPDAVGRLRRFVLDLAVRGKLMPQDPLDEPVSKLIERIGAEKIGRRGNDLSEKKPKFDDSTCSIPASWAVALLQSLSLRLHYGYTASADITLKAVLLLRITDIQDNRVEWEHVPGCQIDERVIPDYALEPGDILIARTGGTIGKSFLVSDVPVKAVFASYLIRVQPARSLCARYLKIFCESNLYWDQLREGTRGGGQPNVNGQTLGRMAVPIPPLAEQHRIVSKIDELMALCDRLEAARAEREATRDRLATASLARLNTPDPDPETFKAHARFAISTALPTLTTRPDQIKQLRHTILNLAVRGRLVPQNTSDEHTSIILKKLSAARKRNWELTRKAKSASYISPDHEEGHFALPPSWMWASALEICESVESGSTPPATEMYDGAGDIPFIKVYNLTKNGSLDFSVKPTFISRSTHEGRLSRSRIRPGDVLMNIVGPPLGKVSLVPHTYPEWNTNQAVVAFRPCEVLLPKYLSVCLLSESVLSWIIDLAQQTVGQVNISVTKSRRLPIPLPPLAEQHHIVAKVDELMQLCDQLEASVESSAAARRRLLDALLHEALAPSKEIEEAA